jgi:DNA-binding response OmpR family regulator
MGKYRLLVISADAEMSEMLQIYFTRLEYEVDCVSTLDHALSRIDLHRPHLILFDVGVAASEVKPLKSKLEGVFSNIPIMWISNTDDRPDRVDGFTLEVDDFITKPFDIEELKLRVRNAIRANERATQKRDS